MIQFKKGINFSLNKKNHLICIVIIATSFFLDRVAKIKIIEHQSNNGTVYINDFINFDLIWNTGVGFGLFNSISGFAYNMVTVLIGTVIVLIIYLIMKSKFIDKILFSLIIGGALGNFYDRVFYYAVPDFIDVHLNKFHWFTFNIADIFITVGIIILITKDLFFKNA